MSHPYDAIELNIPVTIFVECKTCGSALEVEQSGDRLLVVPCDSCMSDAHTEGYDEAREKYDTEED